MTSRKKYALVNRWTSFTGPQLFLEWGRFAGVPIRLIGDSFLLFSGRRLVPRQYEQVFIEIGRAHGTVHPRSDGASTHLPTQMGAQLRWLLERDNAASRLDERAGDRGPFATDADELAERAESIRTQIDSDLEQLAGNTHPDTEASTPA